MAFPTAYAECIEFMTWQNAKAACAAKNAALTASVKGFGYTATGLAGLRGLGFSFNSLVTAGSTPATPTPATPPPALKVSPAPAYDPNDPCYIASLPQCSAVSCPSDYNKVCLLNKPGDNDPPACACLKKPTPAMSPGQQAAAAAALQAAQAAAAASRGPSTAPAYAPSYAPSYASATGGFNHWGLVAAVVAGGALLYLVTQKSSS